MHKPQGIRAAAAAAVVAIVAALFVVTTGPTAVTQEGFNNYIGPGPCPGADWNCEITNGDVVEAVQKAPTLGRNVVDCRGTNCHVAQAGLTSLDTPTNEATCDNDTSVSDEQRCELHQHGGSNTITADFGAMLSNSGQSSITQRSEQRFITTQNGDTNTLSVTGLIDQEASSFLQIPVTHEQRTLQHSNNAMEATTSNVANYTLTRDQTSAATGTTTTQIQDTKDPVGSDPEPDGATVGLGEIDLVANSAGTNKIRIRGADNKDQDTTSLIGTANQTQGHDTGGWKATLDVDSAAPNPDGVPDIDIGEPGSSEGLVKNWNQNAETLPTSTKTQDQDDGISLPLIGNSPFNMISNSRAILVSDTGAHELCEQDASGHAKTRWRGRLFCSLTEGSAPPVTVAVPFDAQDVNASIRCELNQDVCPQGQLHPVSHSHLAVRNLDADPAEEFSATEDEVPGSTSAEPGETIEYKATFHNTGGAVATNATLVLPISPDGQVSCADGCTQGADSVTWSLGDVGQDTAVSRTLQLTVAEGAAPGGYANRATGDDDQEDPAVNTDLVSNETTVTVVEPSPVVREIEIDILEETINASKPKNGATNVVINDPTVIPQSVCFGDLDEGQCTTGTSLGVGDFDNDGQDELKMKFSIRDTGVDPGDERACLTGQTTSGETVHGCDTINAI